LNAGSQLDNLEAQWQAQWMGLEGFLVVNLVDKNTYIALNKLEGDFFTALSAGVGDCADLRERVAADMYQFGDSYIPLTLGEIGSYIKDNADLADLETYFKNRVKDDIAGATAATATPES